MERTPIPLRPDRAALHSAALTSLARAAVAVSRAGLDRTIWPVVFAERQWPHDRDVPLLLRAATVPTSTDTANLVSVTYAFLAALVPLSAGADLLGRGL